MRLAEPFVCFWSFFRNAGSQLSFRSFFLFFLISTYEQCAPSNIRSCSSRTVAASTKCSACLPTSLVCGPSSPSLSNWPLHKMRHRGDWLIDSWRLTPSWVNRDCHETETCLNRACNAPRPSLHNHPSGHLGGWETPWSSEEMLDGQHKRVDIPAHAGNARYGLPQKRLLEDLC